MHRLTIGDLTEVQREAMRRRLLAKTEPDPETGCINWIGSLKRNGYSRFRVGRKVLRAHRVAWELEHGPIGVGQVIRHSCHNRRCVNLEHLQPGTHQDNMHDMTEARRGHCKLTNREVVEIKGLAGFFQREMQRLAAEYSVSAGMVRAILKGQRREDAFDYELEHEAREQQHQGAPIPSPEAVT